MDAAILLSEILMTQELLGDRIYVYCHSHTQSFWETRSVQINKFSPNSNNTVYCEYIGKRSIWAISLNYIVSSFS